MYAYRNMFFEFVLETVFQFLVKAIFSLFEGAFFMNLVFQPIILVLLDIPPMLPVLDGVVMELQDCALPLLRGEKLLCVNPCLNHG